MPKAPGKRKITHKRKPAQGKSATAAFAAARERLDRKKLARQRKLQWAHFWLLCPKCGGDMFEQESLGIRYEVCRDCNGIHLDQAELALAAKHLDPAKLVKAVLTRSKKPRTKA